MKNKYIDINNKSISKSKSISNKFGSRQNKKENKNKIKYFKKSVKPKLTEYNSKKILKKENLSKIINISEEEDKGKNIIDNINNNIENELSNNLNSKENHSDKETNSTDKQNNKDNVRTENIPKRLLGKKRKLVKYKQNSLEYNELYKLYDKNEIDLNINTLFSYTNLNPSKIKGNFIGILNNDKNKENPDFIIEINNQDDSNFNHYIIYDSKYFNKKLSFLENCGGRLYLLYKNYAAFFNDDSIKIYFFSNNNTSYDIFQKIMLPEELQNTILFPFKFIHNDNFYFFYKLFCLSTDNKILLYKFNKEEQKDKNDFAIREKPFVEDEIINLDFEFIWFAQKNNDELLFFYELNYVFKLYCYDLSKKKVTQRKTFTLNNLKYAKIAQYADELINNRFLVLSNQNLLYIVDTFTWDISTIKEHDVIEYFKVFNDNTLWTVESYEKTIIVDNNKKKVVPLMYVRQYKINNTYHELIKIGERKLGKYYSILNNLVQLGNKKIVLFVEGKKIIMIN